MLCSWGLEWRGGGLGDVLGRSRDGQALGGSGCYLGSQRPSTQTPSYLGLPHRGLEAAWNGTML